MKRMIVFSLTLLLLASVSLCVSGSNAFAWNNGTPTPAQVAILDCSVAAPNILVAGFSTSTNVTVTLAVGDQCAQDLAALVTAGLKIKNVQTVGTNLVYTLISQGMLSED